MVEVEIGQRLSDLLTSSILPIIYYEVRNYTNHRRTLKKFDSRLKVLEK